ncbi:MAG TPA: GlsB/YeaQ/YmgE family stress response membrane protein [Gammaproteobacteria bacterium]|nr:GlsB/YeaQ/YmgE family stress response membrane protein [Gammaproteobacteria bacterium]
MPAWSLFVWLAIGAVAGLLARNFLGGTPPFGKLGDIVLGIAGGVVGGYVLALLGIGGGGTVGGLLLTCVAALAGALLLVWLTKLIKVKG